MRAIITDKKYAVMYRKWLAPDPKAVFVLVHGLGAQSARWDFLADFFIKNNISSYAIELKGFGETEGLRGHVDSFDVYYEGIYRICDTARAECPGKKIFIIGESMGALIAFQIVLRKPDLFDGLICLSPAFLSVLKFSIGKYIKIFKAMFFKPREQFEMPFNAEMCTRDKDYREVMDTDDREHRFASAKLLSCIFSAQMNSLIRKNKIKIPVLFLLAGKDSLTTPKISKVIFRGLKVKDKKLIFYPGLHHALSIEKEKEKVFKDMREWVLPRISPRQKSAI
ncbi:MAG: lysophospholipase [Candidatus Omnitrophica bacterium]|nr:lysophospholipase [Candidatus Omnitrophota bacterium]